MKSTETTNVCIILDRSGSMRTFEERNPSVKILKGLCDYLRFQ